MTDVTSEKLYSKLNRINSIKRDLKNTMISVGGYEYFEEDPLFEEYPRILSQIHKSISMLNRALDISVYGIDPEEALTRAETSFKTLMPYVEEIQVCRSLLQNNLNTKGVEADTTDTLRELVNKVNDIEGAKEPFSRNIASFMVNDYFRIDLRYCGTYNSGNTWYEAIYCDIVNVDDNYHPLNDPFFYIWFYNTETGNNLQGGSMFREENVPPHSSPDSRRIITWWEGDDRSALDRFVRVCDAGLLGWGTDDFYISQRRLVHLYLDNVGDVDLEIFQHNEWTYLFWCYSLTGSFEGKTVYGNHRLYMYSPDGERRYYLARTWEDGSTIWNGSWNWWYYGPNSETQRNDMLDWETNEVTIEEDE
jgi:hypothetical protein